MIYSFIYLRFFKKKHKFGDSLTCTDSQINIVFSFSQSISYFLCFIINSPEKHFTSTKKIIKIQILYFFINYTILFQNISSNYVANANNLLLFSKNNSKNLAKNFYRIKTCLAESRDFECAFKICLSLNQKPPDNCA